MFTTALWTTAYGLTRLLTVSRLAADYDHVVVGAGLSGLLLARALLQDHPGGRPRVLVADPRPPDDGPQTFAFWSTGPTPLDRWSIGSWTTLGVIQPDGRRLPLSLDRWRYRAVDWGRGRAELLGELDQDSRVTVVPQAVDAIRDGEQAASARVGGTWVSARWLYDSRPPSLDEVRRATPRSGVVLAQTFRGVWVHTDQDSVDTAAATLMDFSADSSGDLGFVYVLPVSPRSALVMAVRMAASGTDPDPRPAILSVVGDAAWHQGAEESGLTVLATSLPRRQLGRRVLAIGARGGRVRPSTGYAVGRILADTAAIRSSLARHGHPFALPADALGERIMDRVWLRALLRERAGLEPAFVSIFTGLPVDTVWRFLDGEAGSREFMRVATAVPPKPFLRALLPFWRVAQG